MENIKMENLRQALGHLKSNLYDLTEALNNLKTTKYVDAPTMPPQIGSLRPIPCRTDTKDHALIARMQTFYNQYFGAHLIAGKNFSTTHDLRAFTLSKKLDDFKDNEVFTLDDGGGTRFQFSAQEAKQWQASYRVYMHPVTIKHYKHNNSLDLVAWLKKRLSKDLEPPESFNDVDAFCMKFLVRVSCAPIVLDWQGRMFSRKPSDSQANNEYQFSQPGIDFNNRRYDKMDMNEYTDIPESNVGNRGGEYSIRPESEDLLYQHILVMAQLRFAAYQNSGIKFVHEVPIGQGVFLQNLDPNSNTKVRNYYAQAIAAVLASDDYGIQKFTMCFKYRLDEQAQAEAFKTSFIAAFATHGTWLIDTSVKYYRNKFTWHDPTGHPAVELVERDILLEAHTASAHGKTSYLNAADSAGIYGQWWESEGGGALEEGLAKKTLGLLTQHHAINLHISDLRSVTDCKSNGIFVCTP